MTASAPLPKSTDVEAADYAARLKTEMERIWLEVPCVFPNNVVGWTPITKGELVDGAKVRKFIGKMIAKKGRSCLMRAKRVRKKK